MFRTPAPIAAAARESATRLLQDIQQARKSITLVAKAVTVFGGILHLGDGSAR